MKIVVYVILTIITSGTSMRQDLLYATSLSKEIIERGINMTNMMSDDEILSAINEYPDPKYIWIDIWENDQYEIQLVLTINNEPMCHLGTHMVLRVSSLYTDEETTAAIKDIGRIVKKLLKTNFKNSVIHSNLRYR